MGASRKRPVSLATPLYWPTELPVALFRKSAVFATRRVPCDQIWPVPPAIQNLKCGPAEPPPTFKSTHHLLRAVEGLSSKVLPTYKQIVYLPRAVSSLPMGSTLQTLRWRRSDRQGADTSASETDHGRGGRQLRTAWEKGRVLMSFSISSSCRKVTFRVKPWLALVEQEVRRKSDKPCVKRSPRLRTA
jgi:hypothetical protein